MLFAASTIYKITAEWLEKEVYNNTFIAATGKGTQAIL